MAATDRPARGTETDLRSFSVVFNPTAVLQLDDCNNFIRQLPVSHEDEAPAKASMHPRLASVVIVVRAQACVLHFFRGRRLCKIVEFSSPIIDIVGLSRSVSYVTRSCLPRSSLLCLIMCRDGTAYALPTADIIGSAQGLGRAATLAKGGSKRGRNLIATEVAPPNKIHRPCFSEALGLFDDLAPTLMAGDNLCPPQPPPAQHDEDKPGDTNDGKNGSGYGGIVIRAQEQWAIFDHLGARAIAVCDGGNAVAVAGIIDSASLYGIRIGPGESGKHTGQRLGALCAVDGTSPTSSCVVWMGNGGSGEDSPSVDHSDWGDGKGFSLDPRVFRALFGPELTLSAAGAPRSQPPSQSTQLTSKPAVILVGDEAGVVRWSPVPPHPVVPGGVLATLEKAIVGTLPKLEGGCHEGIGLLIVAADGTVLSVTAVGTVCEIARERARCSVESGSHIGGGETSARPKYVKPGGSTDLLSICTLKLPFPISFPCSVPGFLVHCHAGALFASALPAWGGTDDAGGCSEGSREAGGSLRARRGAANEISSVTKRPAGALTVLSSQGDPLPLRPVRLPLPCEITTVAVAPVLSEIGAAKATADDAIGVLQTLIVCLSVRGKLLGFMAPRSVDELDGWGLDSGKGGVRVGGSAGVERRVRCQLERLSSVGRQCAVLSMESAERDREIRSLRGATGLIAALVVDAARRPAHGKLVGRDLQRDGLSSLGLSVSMSADAAENTSYVSVCGQRGKAETLRVSLRTHIWIREGTRGKELPNAGEDGPGRWFVVTRVMSEARVSGNEIPAGEGWAWSTSAHLPMALLRQGCPWISSVALCLPSAEPVTVSTWLQFRFRENSGDDKNGEIIYHMDPGGCCVELGSSRFDVLDWGVALPSVPNSAAAVREAAVGRGACFCGPEFGITDILEVGPSSRMTSLADWGSFRVCVASFDCDASTLLSLLLPASKADDAATVNNDGASVGTCDTPVEYALRVAGQIVVVRAREFSVARVEARRRIGQGRGTVCKNIEIVVMCSHEAMAPVVREALLCRVRALPSLLGVEDYLGHSRGSGSMEIDEAGEAALMVRAHAAARLVREIYPVGQAIVNVSDAARSLGVARAKDGPSRETTGEALALMSRIIGVYKELRSQQERVGAVV